MIRPARYSDFAEIGADPPGPTLRGMTVEIDGKVEAIGGIAYCSGANVAFMEFGEIAHRFEVIRAAKKVMREIISQASPPVLAITSNTETSERFIKHFGFRHHYDDYYIWSGSWRG